MNKHSAILLMMSLFSSLAFAAQPVPEAPMIESHNEVRDDYDLAPLKWSALLAKHAAAWADHLAEENGCRMRHAKGIKEGENLFWGSAVNWSDGRTEVQEITPEKVVESWASEEDDYDYDSNSCESGKMCGHFTQIVWKSTTEVGCAKRICDDKSQVWVCRYSPPGNWVGEKPY